MKSSNITISERNITRHIACCMENLAINESNQVVVCMDIEAIYIFVFGGNENCNESKT